MVTKVPPKLKKKLGWLGNLAVGMSVSDKGFDIVFNTELSPKSVDELASLLGVKRWDISTPRETGEENTYFIRQDRPEPRFSEMKTITVKEDFQLPGTDVVLEEGDKIKVLQESIGGSDIYLGMGVELIHLGQDLMGDQSAMYTMELKKWSRDQMVMPSRPILGDLKGGGFRAQKFIEEVEKAIRGIAKRYAS